MKVEARGIVRDAAKHPDDERIAFFTGLCPLASGTILCGFQVGRSKHAPDATICVCRSRDEGVTWQELPFRFAGTQGGIPGSLAAAEMVEAEPGRLLLFSTWFDRSDPARPLFDPVTEGILRAKQLMAVSADEGDTWTPWEVIPTPGLTGCAMTGPAVRLAGGAICYAFESFKDYDDTSPTRHGSWLMASRDGGRTFGPPFLVAQDPKHRIYYWDQRFCPTPNRDEFIALFWTHDRDEKRDRNVHFLRASLTEGKGAQQLPVETSIPGQIAAPVLLDDGSLLAFVVDRGRPGTLKLWRSRDGGTTWPETDCLVVYVHDERAVLSQGKENVDYAQFWEDMGKWSFGHPAMRPLSPGRVLLAHYAGTPERMSIHWVRVTTADS